jgi:signal transduction histidine kinase
MIEDKDGNLWIGTQMGLSRFDRKSFTNYTKADGLADNEGGDVAMNKDGIIWVASNKGLTALKGFARERQLHDSSDTLGLKPSNELSNAEIKKRGYKPVFEIYGYKTGYPAKAVNNIGVTREGTIWAGTGGFLGDKLIRFDFSNIPINPNPPNVLIQSIKINNEIISWYDLISHDRRRSSNIAKEPVDSITPPPNITEEGLVFGKILNDDQREMMQKKFRDIKFDSITPFYPLPVNLVFPYRHNNITFDFAAIEPARPSLVKYQYMLEGYDKEWNPVSDQTTAAFGNIREGNYTFKLKAQSPDGVWSEPVIYTFKVLPPWYRTWWAYSLYALAFLAAVWIFIRWRIRTLKKEKIVLEEKVLHRTEQLKKSLEELKATQTQLIQSEKMASLGELTAGIAHEIQNPLNFVNNFSEVNTELIDELEQEANKGNIDEIKSIAKDIKENEQKIIHHGKRADAIVKGMLQHSRVGTGQKEPTDINTLADEYLRLSYHGMRAKDKTFNAEIKTDFDSFIGKINIVPQDIGRVLLNLYNNAFYAVQEKQKTTDEKFQSTVSITTKKLNDKVEIRVADNGNGIPQKVLDKIFQPFFTTKPTGQGTGLGLSLAYDIVKAHGGEIKVKTEEDEGAEFIIILNE